MSRISRWFAPVLTAFLVLPTVGMGLLLIGPGGDPWFGPVMFAPLLLAAVFAVVFRRRTTALKWLLGGVLVSSVLVIGIAYAIIQPLGQSVQAAANAPPGPGIGMAPDLAPAVNVTFGVIGILTTLVFGWAILVLLVCVSALIGHLADRSKAAA